MAINSVGNNAATAPSSPAVNPKGILGKDDFLKLLLLQLKYQDPTSPMDSEKILTQTAQLASLESSENTNKSLATLATSLAASMQFSTISAIGKIADTGSNAVVFEGNGLSNFELYFPHNARNGSINIVDLNGDILKTIPLESQVAGVNKFTWNGSDNDGNTVKAGIYYVEANYTDMEGESRYTRVGTYPIESVRFDNGKASVKIGSNYVPFESIKEIVGGWS
ncbi:MAG: flagellar hook capping FlgD N-terminal domain-containing protein [Sulfuricurvum sp.]|nr:flagellar hook capping FlgD N-terminal domain-containing protein [Sulfuricurvum sp.]MDP3023380.1 flagellar hook capping FlgD N-terminal domain-containing protein [Sulfuricurvum sp.]MDP3119485.1 flagellar hook capping FlgD N-terminal domain-containing protein [Sulfuricurvum sp.]